ncbi:MAG: hypothetical protein AAF962_11975 [Actinomycetota bacterium]
MSDTTAEPTATDPDDVGKPTDAVEAVDALAGSSDAAAEAGSDEAEPITVPAAGRPSTLPRRKKGKRGNRRRRQQRSAAAKADARSDKPGDATDENDQGARRDDVDTGDEVGSGESPSSASPAPTGDADRRDRASTESAVPDHGGREGNESADGDDEPTSEASTPDEDDTADADAAQPTVEPDAEPAAAQSTIEPDADVDAASTVEPDAEPDAETSPAEPAVAASETHAADHTAEPGVGQADAGPAIAIGRITDGDPGTAIDSTEADDAEPSARTMFGDEDGGTPMPSLRKWNLDGDPTGAGTTKVADVGEDPGSTNWAPSMGYDTGHQRAEADIGEPGVLVRFADAFVSGFRKLIVLWLPVLLLIAVVVWSVTAFVMG